MLILINFMTSKRYQVIKRNVVSLLTCNCYDILIT